MRSPNADLLERGAVRAAVARWLGDMTGEVIAPTIVDTRKPDTSGSSHDVTFLTARFSDGIVREFVLRRGIDDQALFVDADLAREAQLMDVVNRTGGVPTPELVGFNPDPSVLGTPYLVMARVPGNVAPDAPSYNASGWLADAAPVERRDLWQQALHLMTRVGTVDLNELVGLFPDRQGLHAEFDHWWRNTLWANDGAPSSSITEAFDQLRATIPPDTTAALSWGDARIGNIIFDSGSAATIIDWEMASLGGAYLDVGWWLMTDLVHSTQMGYTRLDGLGTRRETIELWCAETALKPDAIAWHEAFAALKLGVTIGRMTRVAHQRGLLSDNLLTMVEDNLGTRILAALLEVPPRA